MIFSELPGALGHSPRLLQRWRQGTIQSLQCAWWDFKVAPRRSSFTYPLSQHRSTLPLKGLANALAGTREGIRPLFGSRAGLLCTSALIRLDTTTLAHSSPYRCSCTALHLTPSPNDRILFNVCSSHFLSICHIKIWTLCNGNNVEHEDWQHSYCCRSQKISNQSKPVLPLFLTLTGTPATSTIEDMCMYWIWLIGDISIFLRLAGTYGAGMCMLSNRKITIQPPFFFICRMWDA